MKGILAALLLLASMHAMAQKAYTVTRDTEDTGFIYNGLITFNDLDNEATFDWLRIGNHGYSPDDETITYLSSSLDRYTMVVFMGTWCDDSHNLVPKLEKVLQMTKYPMGQLTMYGVDRAKVTIRGENTKYNITFVPTIILFRNGTEVGRITESVKKSVEEDLAAIIAKDMGMPAPH